VLIQTINRKEFIERTFPREYSVMVYTENNNYYAKNQDGITICSSSPTACLQEAVNYLAQFGGGRILVKRGTYYPTTSVNIPDGINLLIEGEGSSTVFRYTSQFTLFRHYPDTPTWSSVIIFRNFKIDRSGSGSLNVDISVVNYAKFVMYDGIELIDDWRGVHGDLGLAGHNNIVAVAENNRVFNKSYGIWLFGHLSIMRNNYVENTAMVGVAGGGLLPNFKLPQGYTPGGLTIIENNMCVDCGRTDEAISVDYLSQNPVVDAFGIIRNNQIMVKNYSMKYAIALVGVSHAIVEGNRIQGSTTSSQIYIPWSKPIKNVVVKNNVINVTQETWYAKPAILANRVVIEGNEVVISSNLNQDTEAWIDVRADELMFRGNKITISFPSGYKSRLAVQIAPLGDSGIIASIIDNYIEGNISDTPIRIGGSAPSRYVVVMRNIIKSTDTTRSFLLLDGRDNDITYYAIVRDNTILGTVKNSVAINNLTDGKLTTAIIDGDVKFEIWRNATGKFYKRNSETATIPANQTRTTVNHSLAVMPTKVLITPLAPPPGKLWVENITNTSFDIVTDTAPTADLPIAWYAEV